MNDVHIVDINGMPVYDSAIPAAEDQIPIDIVERYAQYRWALNIPTLARMTCPVCLKFYYDLSAEYARKFRLEEQAKAEAFRAKYDKYGYPK